MTFKLIIKIITYLVWRKDFLLIFRVTVIKVKRIILLKLWHFHSGYKFYLLYIPKHIREHSKNLLGTVTIKYCKGMRQVRSSEDVFTTVHQFFY